MLRKYKLLLFFSIFFGFAAAGYAQDITISGTVTDSTSGNTLPGVNILVKGTDIGVATDAKGHYHLDVPSYQDTLVFSFIGYVTKNIPINGRTTVNAALAPQVYQGKQLVVIGFGQKEERNLTEAVSSIDSKELNTSPAAGNVGNMLAGKLPGLHITQTSGAPYSDTPNILIRGVGGLTKTRSQPLIIVDGVKANGFRLNSHSIESISVLKDAAATAIYGIEGANGVILITTKRGHKGPAQFSFNTSFGLQRPVQQPEFIGSYRYATLYNQAQLDDGVNPSDLRFSKESIKAFQTGKYPLIYPNTNWVKYLTHNVAPMTHNSLSISGGTDHVKYYISGGFLRQEGIIKTFDVRKVPHDNNLQSRYNLRTNLDIDVTPTTRVSITGYGQVNKHIIVGDFTNPWRHIYQGAPFAGAGLIPAKEAGAPLDYDLVMVTSNSKWDNPYIPGDKTDPLKLYYAEGVDIRTQNKFNLNIKIRQKLNFITKGLEAHFKGSYNSKFEKRKNEDAGEPEFSPYFQTDVNAQYPPGSPGDSDLVFKMMYRDQPLTIKNHFLLHRHWYLEAGINYKRSFGRHTVSGLVLFNQRKTFYPCTVTSLHIPSCNTNGIPRGLTGLVGRVNYNYNERYLLEVNMAYNGSENFAKKHRFGFFPSVSGAWIVTNEPFMKNVNFLSQLKFKASYGIVGSDLGEGRFLYVPGQYYVDGGYGYSFGNAVTKNESAAAENSPIGNPLVSWATAKKQDYGIDLKVLNNQLSMSFEYYLQDRTNILTKLNTVPVYVHAPLPAVNLGEVKNHGYEAVVKWTPHSGHDFTYDISANVTFSRNKIIEQDEVHRQEPYLYRTGHPVGQPFGYIFDGYFSEDWENNLALPTYPNTPHYGDLKYKDLNGDGVINAQDERAIGYPDYPEYSFGINIGLHYKNISLSTLWQGAAHVSRTFSNAPYRIAFGLTGRGGYGTLKWQADGRWTKEKAESGAKITYPIFTTTRTAQRKDIPSNFWIVNSPYLRLKNAVLSYTLPSSLFKNTRIKSMRVFVNGYDLLTFSPMKSKYGLDPERTKNGQQTAYPIVEIYNFGIHVQF